MKITITKAQIAFSNHCRYAVAAEQERQRLAALQRQRDDFIKFCKPGMRYAGTFEHTIFVGGNPPIAKRHENVFF